MTTGPSDLLRRAEDEMAIESNRRAGGDPSKPTGIEFWVYLPTRSSVDAFVRAARHAGYDASVHAPVPADFPSKNPWTVRLMRRDRLTIEVITKYSDVLDSLVKRYGGDFDGWDADVNR